MNNEQFINELEKLGIKLDEIKLKNLEKYYGILIKWNEKMNLTSIVKKEDVYLKHFYDSLTLIKAINLNDNLSLCDIGTGAGFPGLVLRICFDNVNITLVDALEKRVKFLNHVIKELNLQNIKVVHARAEEYAKDNREKYDLVVSRAVAKLNILNEICIPLLKTEGIFIAMKSNAKEEIETSKNGLKELSSDLENIISFNLPIEESKRNLIIIRKKGITKDKYPRNFNKIKKNPL